MNTWDKFAWIEAVGADGRLTVGTRFVMMQTALNWTTVDRPTFHIRQDTIAERLAVSLRLVNGAVAQAKRFGYIVLYEPRKRGNGQHGADTWRLVIPAELYANPAYHSESCTQGTTELYARNDEVVRTDCQSYTHETTENNAPTSGNGVPKALTNALDKALVSAPARVTADRLALPDVNPEEEQPETVDAELVPNDPDPQPDEFCHEHMPDGIDDDCRKCMRARLRHDKWKQRQDRDRLADLFRIGDTQPATPIPPRYTPDAKTPASPEQQAAAMDEISAILGRPRRPPDGNEGAA